MESSVVRPRQARCCLFEPRKNVCLIVEMKSRFAIRAARFGARNRRYLRGRRSGNSMRLTKRGSFEGALRIPLRSPSFLFNDLVFPRIPRKSLKFRRFLFRSPPPLPILLLKAKGFRNRHRRPFPAFWCKVSVKCPCLSS